MVDNRRTCFVLMPLAEEFREVYDQVYKPVCESKGIQCWRVDEKHAPGSITRDIVEGILEADIIIADLTGQNPNVFYELGIAHSSGNKTIMTSQNIGDVPFDIANYRVLIYGQSISGGKKLASDLSKAIDELLQALERTNNPVQDVLHGRRGTQGTHRTPVLKALPVAQMSPPLRKFLKAKGFAYVDELLSFDWGELLRTKGVGKESVGQFFYLLLSLDLSETDIERINDFVLKHDLDVSHRSGWRV